ncbi:phospholipase A2 inhibitor and Ly6/PLAUR domain-containing protein-like [Hyla sarda]|uniref:phospholipase A2 inhibitor and Ly6/PLAUR domain-containing protein-like n=1 Tax=Hyla sarda TaxID=327740 RepID=UPI0024C32727|nr:phospholipase A2 inhibitor and Ly6/PLAUR domain-containing protein-like [Hyla sarda]
MISLTGILSLLSALAATSYALSCTQCVSTTSYSCSGSSVTCPPGYRCGSAYTESSVSGERVSVSLFRACIASHECNFNGSLSIQHGKAKRVTSCCNTNHCTPTIPPFPTQSSDPNGVVCRSCISADSTWCYTSDTIQCTGDENMCLLQTTKIRGSVSASTAVRGCGTKSLCDLGGQLPDISGLSLKTEFICTSDGIRVCRVVLTPAIMCLLLLKWSF